MIFLKRLSIGVKLPVVMVFVTVLAIFAMGIVSFYNARDLLVDQTKSRLSQLLWVKKYEIERFFGEVDRDIKEFATNNIVREILENPSRHMQSLPTGAKASVSDTTRSTVDSQGPRATQSELQLPPPLVALTTSDRYEEIILLGSNNEIVYTTAVQGGSERAATGFSLNQALTAAEGIDPGHGTVLVFANDPTSTESADAKYAVHAVYSEQNNRIGLIAIELAEALTSVLLEIPLNFKV